MTRSIDEWSWWCNIIRISSPPNLHVITLYCSIFVCMLLRLVIMHDVPADSIIIPEIFQSWAHACMQRRKIDCAAGLTGWMQKIRWTLHRTALRGKQFTAWPLEANRRPWPPWRGTSWRSPCRYAVTAWSSETAVHMQINTAYWLAPIAGHILRHRTTVSGPFLIFGAL